MSSNELDNNEIIQIPTARVKKRERGDVLEHISSSRSVYLHFDGLHAIFKTVYSPYKITYIGNKNDYEVHKEIQAYKSKRIARLEARKKAYKRAKVLSILMQKPPSLMSRIYNWFFN